MDILMNQDLQGQPLRTAQPMQIRWQRRMNFDGMKATFEQSVVAVGPTQRLQTNVMEVLLDNPSALPTREAPAARSSHKSDKSSAAAASLWRSRPSIPSSNSSRGSGWRSRTWRSIG